jgi:hypothetical protein
MTSSDDLDYPVYPKETNQREGPANVSVSRQLYSPKRPSAWHERDRAPCFVLSDNGKTVTVVSKSLASNMLAVRATC